MVNTWFVHSTNAHTRGIIWIERVESYLHHGDNVTLNDKFFVRGTIGKSKNNDSVRSAAIDFQIIFVNIVSIGEANQPASQWTTAST